MKFTELIRRNQRVQLIFFFFFMSLAVGPCVGGCKHKYLEPICHSLKVILGFFFRNVNFLFCFFQYNW